MRKIAMLAMQYERTITDMAQQQTVRAPAVCGQLYLIVVAMVQWLPWCSGCHGNTLNWCNIAMLFQLGVVGLSIITYM